MAMIGGQEIRLHTIDLDSPLERALRHLGGVIEGRLLSNKGGGPIPPLIEQAQGSGRAKALRDVSAARRSGGFGRLHELVIGFPASTFETAP
jgi:hypothetical protein